MLRFLTVTVLAGFLASLAFADSAETPKLRNINTGFASQSVNHRWQPVVIGLENPGPARTVTLVLEPASRAAGQTLVVSKPVWLPANSRRTVWLSMLPEIAENTLPQPGRKDAPDVRIIKCFTVKLTDGGVQTFQQDYALGRYIPDTAATALVVDNRSTSYRFPEDISVAGSRRPVSRTVTPLAGLPGNVVEYDGVSLLILGDPGPGALLPLQRQAILDWVHAGGTLVFVPGPTTTADWLASWAEILPVTYGQPDRLATEPRLSRWGEPPVFTNGIAFRRLTLRDDARLLFGDTNSPLVAIRQEGLGNVIATAFDAGDLQFQHWGGVTNFTTELMAIAQRNPLAPDRILERSTATDAIVTSLAGIKVLGRGPLLGYLVFLLAAILCGLLAFRLTRTPERGWLITAVFAFCLGGAVIVFAGQWKGQPRPFLNEITIVHVAPDASNAVAHAALGLYSPNAASFALAAGNHTVQVRAGSGNRVSAETFGIELDAQLRIPALAVRQSDVRAIYGQAALPAAARPHAAARLTPTGLDLTAANPTERALDYCFFKFNRFVAPLGDLPAAAHREFRNLTGSETYSSRLVRSAEDELRAKIRRVFFPDPIYTMSRGNAGNLALFHSRVGLIESSTAAVYGWTDSPLFPLTSDNQSLARRAVGLWAIPATLTITGPRVDLPRGFLTLRQLGKESRIFERGDGHYSGTRPATIEVEFSLPPECPDLQIDNAKVFVEFRSGAFQTRVQVRSVDGKRQATLTGSPYTIAQPGQWYDPAKRSFVVAVSVEPVGSRTDRDNTAVNYWQIRELEMEIGGTVP